jgi:methionyl-tRNA formyltransferase
MKKLVLFLNGELGLRVLEYLCDQSIVQITCIVLNNSNKRPTSYINEVKILLASAEIVVPILDFETIATSDDNDLNTLFEAEHGVSVLFGHIIPERVLHHFKGKIINLHPSLLPTGRGADPIPWSIIEDKPQGITIHIIDSGLDTGDILQQKVIDTNISMNAGSIYVIATEMLFTEFVYILPLWLENSISPFKQQDFSSTSHRTKELKNTRVLLESDVLSVGELLRKLQALTFADGRKPMFRDNSGRVWSIEISISPFDGDIEQ